MKKMIATVIACTLVLVMLIGIVYAAGSPNKGSKNQTGTTSFSPYVQCQPSYNDGGQHAARGYYSIYEIDVDGIPTGISSSGSTSWGTSVNDSRILLSQGYFSVANGNRASFDYSFT